MIVERIISYGSSPYILITFLKSLFFFLIFKPIIECERWKKALFLCSPRNWSCNFPHSLPSFIVRSVFFRDFESLIWFSCNLMIISLHTCTVYGIQFHSRHHHRPRMSDSLIRGKHQWGSEFQLFFVACPRVIQSVINGRSANCNT